MTWYTSAWIVWGALFALIEGLALVRRIPGATLSEHVWSWLRVRDARPTGATVTMRVLLGVVLVWLVGHLTMGWWTLTDPWPW